MALPEICTARIEDKYIHIHTQHMNADLFIFIDARKRASGGRTIILCRAIYEPCSLLVSYFHLDNPTRYISQRTTTRSTRIDRYPSPVLRCQLIKIDLSRLCNAVTINDWDICGPMLMQSKSFVSAIYCI